MDLSQLSGLLEGHTATISTLYARLGAPSTTVASKLEELHDALISTVNKQRESAEKEVAEVQTVVDTLRTTLADQKRRLGETRTSITQSVNKEGETLLQARARLEKEEAALVITVEARQKQLATVKARLDSFVVVLGKETVYPDDAQVSDGMDLSLVRLSKMEKEIARCEQEVKHREQLLASVVQEIFNLWTDLGISPSASFASTSASPPATPTTTPEEQHFELCILHTLGMAIPSSASFKPIEPLHASHANLLALQEKKKALEDEQSRRMDEIQELYDELCTMWQKLGVPEEEMDEFVEVWKGTEQRCIDAYRAELQRMLVIKAENMVLFIAREREEIQALWDALYYSPEDRANFALFESDMGTEEVLLAHEMEKARLQAEQNSKTEVLERMEKYFALLSQMAELQASANDPARLTGKGQRGDPGRLLREEKIRKRVQKEKPKLEQELLRFIPMWEDEYGQPFLVNGSRFVEDLQAKIDEEGAGKGAAARTRTKSTTAASAPTPSQASSQPALKRQMTGSAARPGSAQSQHPPSTATKRARTNTMTGSQAAQVQRPMYTGSSVASTSSRHVPVTPCPPSLQQQQGQNFMLVPQSTGMSSHTSSTSGPPSNASRLPLKAQSTGVASGQSNSNWSQLGFGRQPGSGPLMAKKGVSSQSLFSPPGVASMQQQQPHSTRQSFRPRPSLASVSTGVSSASFASSNWGLRTASSATSVDSRASGC